MALNPGLDPPPLMANAILNFHFDYLNPSLTNNNENAVGPTEEGEEKYFQAAQRSLEVKISQ